MRQPCQITKLEFKRQKKKERDETDSANRKQTQMKALKIRKKPKMMSESRGYRIRTHGDKNSYQC